MKIQHGWKRFSYMYTSKLKVKVFGNVDSVYQTKTAVFTLLLNYLLLADHISTIQLDLGCMFTDIVESEYATLDASIVIRNGPYSPLFSSLAM